MSSSRDGSLECSDLTKYFFRDLMNDVAIVDDRFNILTEGMFIVCDLLGVDEAEVTWCGLSISWKVLNIDVDSPGGGSSGDTLTKNMGENTRAEAQALTGRFLRISWGRSAGDGDRRFGHDRSQDAILVSWFAPPCLTVFVTEVIATLVGIIAHSPETFRESTFVL